EPADPQDRDPRQLATRLPFLALGGSAPPHAVLQQVAHLLRASPSSSSHRFVNQLFGGRENLAVAAEVLATIRNNSMYTFKAAGAQVLVERELIAHMGRKVGFERAEGSFCPGGSMANLLALLLARNAHFPDAREHGCRGELVAIYTSKEGHYSIQKAAGILGLGRSSVRTIPVDDRGRMRADRLRRCIAEDQEQGIRPVLVNATAGTTVRGAFDPLRDLAAVATAAGAWFHVDGALGATAVLSPSTRQLVDGLELADSISWNPHKMMGVPLQCSLLLVSRPSALAQSLDETADYLFQTDDASNDPGRRSIQCGRRNDALKLWAAWRRLGDEGFSARVDRQFALARFAASAIAADPSFVLIEEPSSINVCFRVRGVDPAALCEVLHRSGRLSIGHGLVGTQRALRLVCVNPEIGEPELRAILDEILQAATGLCERVADRS
ncbi:MAG: aminotransferase class V-fold PLP-dependent enzyme, partial [Planctomycetota bacterium]